MDIRIAAYRPVTVQSFGGSQGRAVAVSDARQSGPVPAIAAIGTPRPNAQASLQVLANQLRQSTQTANGGGYTDSIRGGNLNILA